MSDIPSSLTLHLGEALSQKLRIAAAYNQRSVEEEAVQILKARLESKPSEEEEDWMTLYRKLSDEQRHMLINLANGSSD